MGIRKIVAVLLLLGGVATVGWYWQYSHWEESESVGLKVYGNIDTRLVNLAFEASGRIQQLTMHEGARVKTGALLARLDTRRLELMRDAAAAKVQAQQEVVREMEAGTRPEEIRKLEAELAAVRAQAENLARSFRRIRDLEQRNLASSQQSEDARTAASAAKENVRAVEAGLALALAGPRREQIAAARATLAALESEAALRRKNLQDAELFAPGDGIIQSRILEVGDMASPERPVYTLALTEPLWARVYLPETLLGKVRPGMPATIYSDSFPDRSYKGWVGYISPSAEFTPKAVQTEETRTDLVYQARIFTCNPRDELRLGMPVSVVLDPAAEPLRQPECAAEERP